jgi:hypothetical protein
MRKIAIIAVCAGLVGCTSVSHPSGWTYRSVGFQKTIAELQVGTNGTLHMKGYASKDSQMAEGIAAGVAKGLASGANPLP